MKVWLFLLLLWLAPALILSLVLVWASVRKAVAHRALHEHSQTPVEPNDGEGLLQAELPSSGNQPKAASRRSR